MLKNAFFNYKTNMKIKATTTTAIKNELNYFPILGGNICIAEPNLEVLPLSTLKIIQ